MSLDKGLEATQKELFGDFRVDQNFVSLVVMFPFSKTHTCSTFRGGTPLSVLESFPCQEEASASEEGCSTTLLIFSIFFLEIENEFKKKFAVGAGDRGKKKKKILLPHPKQ